MSRLPIAIIGGGLTGLTCALRLAEQGEAVHLFEAAPELGGRTKSFYERQIGDWVDNGPHLLIGAYQTTQKLLEDVDAADHVTWQRSLQLPLWDQHRGFFSLTPPSWLPLPLALLIAIAQMPGHGLPSIMGMMRIAKGMKKPVASNVAAWLAAMGIPPALKRDMLEPLCLGAMNTPMDRADSHSFARVLEEAFASHASARLGWFNRPLSQALIQPIEKRLEALGVAIHRSTPVRSIEREQEQCKLFDSNAALGSYARTVVALPAYARNRLLDIDEKVSTEAITNVHLWFEEHVELPAHLLGCIGTYSQWFFDVSAQTGEDKLSHLCAVISADAPADRSETLRKVLEELESVMQRPLPKLLHSRIVCEQRATVLTAAQNSRRSGGTLFDASESPRPGDLPATIEAAVLRGEEAAQALCLQPLSQVIH